MSLLFISFFFFSFVKCLLSSWFSRVAELPECFGRPPGRRGGWGCGDTRKSFGHVCWAPLPPLRGSDWRPVSWFVTPLAWQRCRGVTLCMDLGSWIKKKKKNIYSMEKSSLSIALTAKRKQKMKWKRVYHLKHSYINSFCICCYILENYLFESLLFDVFN